jgi:hypothetical protein
LISLISGIVSIPLGCVCGFFGLFAAIPAIVTGFMGRKKIKASGGWKTGDGMALAGIIIGFVGLGIFVLFLVLYGFTLFAGS